MNKKHLNEATPLMYFKASTTVATVLKHSAYSDIVEQIEINKLRYQEENFGILQVWFIHGYNFQMQEKATFSCSNNYMEV